jgi:hypothetical protein
VLSGTPAAPVSEGWKEQCDYIEAAMKLRADRWNADAYPFGSEMAWDSTGQEIAGVGTYSMASGPFTTELGAVVVPLRATATVIRPFIASSR